MRIQEVERERMRMVQAEVLQREEQERRQVAEQNRIAREDAVRNLLAAFNGADPSEVPLGVLAEWTDNFDPANQIGAGAFGEVYQVTRAGVPRLAVKRLSQHIRLHGAAEERAAALLCVRREVNLLSAFRHPSIIRLLGYTSWGDRGAILAGAADVCLVYELALRGGLDDNLRADDRARELTPVCRVRIAADVARALNYLHCRDPGAPAYHRDLKSANVALTADRRAKLIDCGLAKHAPQDRRPPAGSVLTGSQARLGTPGYMCRKYVDTGVYDARSEVFSLGIVLLELLSGRLQVDAQRFDLYEAYVEEEGDICQGGLDLRGGAWDPACAASLLALARECAARHARRLSPMLAVVRRLVGLESRHCRPTDEERALAGHNAALLAELEALRAPAAPAAGGGVGKAAAPRACSVCLDDAPGDAGAECPAGARAHWVCRACFAREVSAQLAPDSRGALAARGGQVVCRQCLPAAAAYPARALARALDDEGFAAWRRAEVEVEVSRAGREREEQLEKQLAALRAELSTRDGREDAALRHRLHVAERILCLRCPRGGCGQAFVDFAGCFALTCGRCGCGFCAYCLADCGADAHRHVAACPLNTAPGREVFGRAELFERAQGRRREAAVAAYLAESVATGDRDAVRAAIRGDMERLGLRLP